MTNGKLKVGDKVRIIANDDTLHYHNVGDEGVVTEVCTDGKEISTAYVRVGTMGQYVNDNDLELIVDADSIQGNLHDTKFKPGDKVEYISSIFDFTGAVGTVVSTNSDTSVVVNFEGQKYNPYTCFESSLELFVEPVKQDPVEVTPQQKVKKVKKLKVGDSVILSKKGKLAYGKGDKNNPFDTLGEVIELIDTYGYTNVVKWSNGYVNDYKLDELKKIKV